MHTAARTPITSQRKRTYLPAISEVERLRLIATQVRRDILRMTYLAQSGHPGGSLGLADILTALYFSVMDIGAPRFDMWGTGEDVFILSNGHCSPALYSVLARRGYFPVEELASFRRIHSRLQGHPSTLEKLPGIYIATGSLGQGFSVAIGAALAKRLNRDQHLVWCITGDGELQEGQIWEGATFAAHHRVDQLITIVDWNGQQIDGPVERVMSLGDLPARWKACGWIVLEMDGNNMSDVLITLHKARQLTHQGKPIVVLAHTHMGYPVDFMMDDYRWHGIPPNKEQLERALAQLPETLGDFPAPALNGSK